MGGRPSKIVRRFWRGGGDARSKGIPRAGHKPAAGGGGGGREKSDTRGKTSAVFEEVVIDHDVIEEVLRAAGELGEHDVPVEQRLQDQQNWMESYAQSLVNIHEQFPDDIQTTSTRRSCPNIFTASTNFVVHDIPLSTTPHIPSRAHPTLSWDAGIQLRALVGAAGSPSSLNDVYLLPADFVYSELDSISFETATSGSWHEVSNGVEFLEARRQQHFNADDVNLVPNQERFLCTICYCDVEPGEGVVLHECLHSFCKPCLEGHVKSLTEARAGCPFIVEKLEKCDKDILEREIKEFASAEVYKTYLQRGVDEHKTRTEERLECKTPGCKYWIVVDGAMARLKYFLCEICHHVNCVTCEAVHENDTCEEYLKKQRNIRNADANDKEFEARITAGLAMRCPGCKIVVERDAGCDFVQCTACQMEICWITKQRRWGPKGKGDTSAGCKCRSKALNGKACHPKCGTCH